MDKKDLIEAVRVNLQFIDECQRKIDNIRGCPEKLNTPGEFFRFFNNDEKQVEAVKLFETRRAQYWAFCRDLVGDINDQLIKKLSEVNNESN